MTYQYVFSESNCCLYPSYDYTLYIPAAFTVYLKLFLGYYHKQATNNRNILLKQVFKANFHMIIYIMVYPHDLSAEL